MSWRLLYTLRALWPLGLDGFVLWAIAGVDLQMHFDGPMLAGWSALVMGVGFLSGWIAHRQMPASRPFSLLPGRGLDGGN